MPTWIQRHLPRVSFSQPGKWTPALTDRYVTQQPPRKVQPE